MLGKTSVRLVIATWGLLQRDTHAVRVRSDELELDALSKDYDAADSHTNVSNSPAPCLQLGAYDPFHKNCYYALSPVAKQGGCQEQSGPGFEKHCRTLHCKYAAETARTSKSLALSATIPLWAVPLATINAVIGGEAIVEYAGNLNEPGVKSIFLSASIGVEIKLGGKWLGVTVSFAFVGSLTIECSTCKHFTSLWSGLLTQLIHSSKDKKILTIPIWGSDTESTDSKFQKTWTVIKNSVAEVEELEERTFSSLMMDVRWTGGFEAKAEVYAEIPGIVSVKGGMKVVPTMETHYRILIKRGESEQQQLNKEWVIEMLDVVKTKVFKVGTGLFFNLLGKVDVEGFCDGEALEFKVVLESAGETLQEQVEGTAKDLKDVAKESLDLAITDVKTIEKTITDGVTTSLDTVKTSFTNALKAENIIASRLPKLKVTHWIETLQQLLVDGFGSDVAEYCNTKSPLTEKQSAIIAVGKIQTHFTNLIRFHHAEGVETLTVRVLADKTVADPLTGKAFPSMGIPGYCRDVLKAKGKVAQINLVRTTEDDDREPAANQVDVYEELLQKDASGKRKDTGTVFREQVAKWVEKGIGIKTHTTEDLIAAELNTDSGRQEIEALEAIPPAKSPRVPIPPATQSPPASQWLEVPENTRRFKWRTARPE